MSAAHGPEVLVRLAKIRRKRLPDVMFVAKARREIVHKTQIDGPLDLIIEGFSPDSAERDWVKKYGDYERAGVREYWIIDRDERRVEAYGLATGGCRRIRANGRKVASAAVRGFLPEDGILGGTLPRVLKVVGGMGVSN